MLLADLCVRGADLGFWFNSKAPIVDVVVDPYLANVMRPHQREGVSFLYSAVMGMRSEFDGEGAILADEMLVPLFCASSLTHSPSKWHLSFFSFFPGVLGNLSKLLR